MLMLHIYLILLFYFTMLIQILQNSVHTANHHLSLPTLILILVNHVLRYVRFHSFSNSKTFTFNLSISIIF